VIEQFWWAPGIYPGQIKTQSQRNVQLWSLKWRCVWLKPFHMWCFKQFGITHCWYLLKATDKFPSMDCSLN